MEKTILDALYFVANKGWSESPQSYFNSLVAFLGANLSATWALVDELGEDGHSARTVGLYGRGSLLNNLEYSLAGTPCENVMGRRLCSYPAGVQQLFPQDPLLVEMAAESYVGIPLWSSNGKPIGLIAVLWTEPLTPEKREAAEGVLQIVALRCAHELDSSRHESRLREYEQLLNELTDGFYLADCRGQFRDTNAAFCRMLGYECSELYNMSLFDLTTPESLDATREHIAKVVSTGQVRFETRLHCKSGRIIDTEVSALYCPSGGGRFAVTVRDVTENKQAERQRQALESRLYHAQGLEAVGRLAGGVAHDFNNMLAVILGQTELLLSDPSLSAEIRESLLDVRGAAERSATLTSQLLAFARKQRTKPQIVDISVAIERMLQMLGRLIGENIALDWKLSTDLWHIRVDPTQFDQIVANLCVNARDAMPSGGQLTISTAQGSYVPTLPHADSAIASGDLAERDYVCLSVSDTGSGMDEETKKHIFEPFFSTKGPRSGTGLGLATVYGVVTQSGGFIEVDSSPGVGSTFRLYFPRCAEDAASGVSSTRRVKASSDRISILLVEDEPRVMRLIARMVKTMGYDVFTAAGPLEALQIIRRQGDEITLLLTDVIMPDMNGRQLLEQVRAHYPTMKCLYMSGYSAEVIAGQGVMEDGTRLIQKPFKPAELEEAIASVLREEQDLQESTS